MVHRRHARFGVCPTRHCASPDFHARVSPPSLVSAKQPLVLARTFARRLGRESNVIGLWRQALLGAMAGAALALAGCGGGGGDDGGMGPTMQPTEVVNPLPLPGPNAVACSNVSQNFGRVTAGVDVTDYWE